MPGVDDMDQDRRGWHIDKGIPPAVIATIVLAVMGGAVGLVNMAVGQDRRIGDVELTVRYLQQSRVNDQQRADKKYDDLKTDLRIIGSKIDKLNENLARRD